jgi:NAD+ synthase (glutamine-hydrolysing)
MKIALGQIEVVPGKPDVNISKMLKMIDQAKEKGVHLIVFPEMSVGGYLLGDKWTSEEFCLDLMNKNKALIDASNGIAIAFGNVFVDNEINKRVNDNNLHPNKDGRVRKYNAVYVFQNGKPAKRLKETKILPEGVEPKTLLPNYRIFDDQRYFYSKENIAIDFNSDLKELYQPFLIEVNGQNIPIGFEICEDLWCEDYRRNLQALNPTKMLIENGARFIINISASPWTFGKNSARDRRVLFLKKESNNSFVPFFYVNCTGAQNNGKNIITFDGGSTVYNKDGLSEVFAESAYKEELIITDTDNLGFSKKREEKSKIAQKYSAIIQGIRYMKSMNGLDEHQSFVIGLSGGIDSAVVAALLVIAVGKEKVFAINMPTKYNSEKTKDAALYIAKKLGISYTVIPIEDISNINEELIDRFDIDRSMRKLSILNIENVQAKIRGTTILSNLAAKYGALFPNNGNKVEVMLGYATLYGDINGSLCPIADLTKCEVVELAKYLNNEIFKDKIIPESLIPDKLWRFREDQIMPTAELKEKQVDPMKFGYHCALIEAMMDYKKISPAEILEMYLNGKLDSYLDKYFEGLFEKPNGLTYELMKRWEVDNPRIFIEDFEWFIKLFYKNIFKRIQAPPIIITSKTSFGYDLRESILPYVTTNKYNELKEKILSTMTKYIPKI